MAKNQESQSESPKFGLLDLLFPVFFIPVKGVVWIAEKLTETAEADITDKAKVQEELLELQMRFELEEIGEDEYNRREEELLDQLEAIREYEERKGG